MSQHRSLRLLCCLGVASGLASGQCYDLGETRLYQPKGRFIEWWKDSDFHVDNSEYGELFQFTALAGVIRKTEAGWVAFRATRKPFHLCEPGVRKDGGYTCFMQPYFPPSSQAIIRPTGYQDIEVWTLSKEGIFQYKRHYEGGVCYLPCGGTHDVAATLNLNTMAYDVSIKGHAIGVHRHLNKDGIELWRNQPFQARAVLKETACPVVLRKASLRLGVDGVEESEMTALPPCVAKLKPKAGTEQASFEFIYNPRQAASPRACIVVHEEPMTVEDSGLTKAAGR